MGRRESKPATTDAVWHNSKLFGEEKQLDSQHHEAQANPADTVQNSPNRIWRSKVANAIGAATSAVTTGSPAEIREALAAALRAIPAADLDGASR